MDAAAKDACDEAAAVMSAARTLATWIRPADIDRVQSGRIRPWMRRDLVDWLAEVRAQPCARAARKCLNTASVRARSPSGGRLRIRLRDTAGCMLRPLASL